LTASNPDATYSEDISTVKRPNAFDRQFEVFTHRWIDLTDISNAFVATILTGPKNGSDKPNDNTLRVTLIRTPGEHPSGLTRCPSDALDRAGAKYIIVLEGVNDIGHSSLIKAGLAQAKQEKSPEMPITASDLILAMTQMIDAAHARGIKVIGATLTPYGGANYERPDGEEIHNELDEFIRHGGKFDGVVDFEKGHTGSCSSGSLPSGL
jgi:hypothetical protein